MLLEVKLAIVISLFSVFSLSFSAHARYKMEDLEILFEQKSFKEFLDHAHDIRPSLRKKLWKDMLSSMAQGRVQRLIELNAYSSKSFKEIETYSSWNSLQDDPFYLEVRGSYLLSYLKTCFANKEKEETCWQDFSKAWTLKPLLPHHVFELTKSLDDEQVKKIYPELKNFFSLPSSGYLCQVKALYPHLAHTLVLLSLKEKESGGLRKKVLREFHEECLNSLYPKIKKALKTGANHSEIDLLPLLKAFKQLSPHEEAIIHISYLLENPVSGDLFNKSWTTMIMLKERGRLRDTVLEDLKNRRHLPDKIFSLPDKRKKHTIARELKKSLPEYLDFYAKNCLAYYNGKTSFPYGNPTKNCFNFLEIAQKEDLLPQTVLDKLSKIKKL